MATKITSANFAPTILSAIVGPAISSVQIANGNTYATIVDDTAVPLAGGYIVLNGTGFVTGCQVYLDSTIATTVTFVSSTRINVQVPAMAAGTYVIYLVNGDGSIAIRVNGLTYSIAPAWSTASDLGGVAFGTAISLQLAAPSDTSITYTLQNGSTLPTGLSLSSTGLLSGTVTIETETTYNFTVVATDIELQDSPRTFSVSIVVSDPYFKYTTLLLNGETATTNWITDASTNNFNIIPTGDTRPSAFSPYNTSWSNYFDAVGDSLTFTNSASLSFGTSAYTVEFWVYLLSYANSNNRIIDLGTSANSWGVQINNTGSIAITKYGTTDVFTSSVGFVLNSWNHVAIVRSSTAANDTKIYLNGAVLGTTTDSNTWSVGTTPRINDAGASLAFSGYVSNVRIVNGTAVYTTAFTPPTTSLTAVANTVLLTCQSNRFKDNSTNNFTLTRNGDVAVNSFGPFTETDTVTGSAYFDGSGDYLKTGTATPIATSQSTFTVEAFIYMTANPSSSGNPNIPAVVGDMDPTTGAANWTFGPTSSRALSFYWYTGSLNSAVGNTIMELNAWHHIAVSVSANAISLYVNGVLQTLTGTTTLTNRQSTLNYIGFGQNNNTNHVFTGYASNIRIVSGTALYTTAFTSPTVALTAVTNTGLLTLQNRTAHNNSTFLDTSGNKTNITRSGNTTQGTFTPFSQPAGSWSGYFGGTGYYATTPFQSLPTTTTTFTIEAWIYQTAYPVAQGSPVMPSLVGDQNPTGAGANWVFGIIATGALSFWWNDTGAKSCVGNTITSLNTWTHVAVSVSANAISLFVNGVLQTLTGTTTLANRGTDQGKTTIGQYAGTNSYIYGYVSNLRIVTGTALYTGTFTTSTAKLTAVTGTTLLTLQNNAVFADASTNNRTITPTLASAQSFSPFAPTASYSIATVGASAYFDGTLDSLVLSSAISFESANFTVETWVYPTSVSTNMKLFGAWTGYQFWFGTNGRLIWQFGASNSPDIAALYISLNQWAHIAWVRSGNSILTFINGVLKDTTAYTGTVSSGILPAIGKSSDAASDYYYGYISDLRVVKGTAVYTATFTPPTAPLTATVSTVLLLSGTSAGVIDASGRNDLETVGDARISTALKKYGTGSMYFDGTGDYLVGAASPNLALGTGNFTVEGWIYMNAIPSAGAPEIVLMGNFHLNFRGSGTFAITNDSTVFAQSPIPLVAGQWYHFAAVRNSGSTTVYVNGVGGTAVACATDFTGTSLKIGGDGSTYINCYIDELRVTRGVARYIAAFTPPAAAAITR